MRLAADIDRLTMGIAALRIVRALIREGEMGKMSSVADRIRDTKKRLDDEADKLAARLDAIDEAAPKAFDRGHAFIKAQHAEVDEIEATLRQLSNLPLEPSADSPTDYNATARAAQAEYNANQTASTDHAAFVRRTQQP